MRSRRQRQQSVVKIMAIMCGGWLCLTAAQGQDGFPLKDGDTWVMLGDSITAQYLHSNYIEAYCYARFPKWSFHFRNSGVSGDTIPSALKRFDYDVAGWKPSVVSVELGMNDHRYAIAAEAYIANMKQLTDRIARIGARPVLISSSPINNGLTTNSPAGSAMLLIKYSTALREFAAKQKAPFADQFAKLANIWAANKPVENVCRLADDVRSNLKLNDAFPGREQQTQWLAIWEKSAMFESGASLGGDPVHPGAVGQLTMCAAILQEFKAPGLVSKATLDATGKIGELVQCQISNVIVETGGGLSFDRLDDCLPMPIPDDARGALLVYPSIADCSQWMLTIASLKPGNYQVSLDGTVVATVTADELAKGWNMGALAKGAVAAQGQVILQLVAKKEGLVSQWRRQSATLAQSPSESLRVALDQLNSRILAADAKIREAAQPNSHRFAVKPVNRL